MCYDETMKIAYLDCFSGISGDMFIGALLHAGLPFEQLRAALETLPLDRYRIAVSREARHHISGARFHVEFDRDDQPSRHLPEIRDIIRQATFSETVKDRAVRIFEALARAEGEIHGRPPEEVHFHEVGAVDAIVDICGTVYGLEALGITSLHVSPLPLGSGFTTAAHGRIPVPAPATLALLKGFPVYDSGVEHEMVTPTGAALASGLGDSFGPMPSMSVTAVGYGVGSRDLPDRPNLARIVIGDDASERADHMVAVIEANLDDMIPEWTGHLMARLFEAGALDVVFTPVYMKKNRPGVQVQVIAPPHLTDALMDLMLTESTTLGVRVQHTRRRVLRRTHSEVDSPWGKIRVKEAIREDGSRSILPEYEACREIAAETGRPLKEIYYWIMGLNRP